MGYVALSRVRSLDTLSLAGINRMALRVSDDALAIEKHLQQASSEAEKVHQKLEKLAIKKQKQNPKGKSAKSGDKTPWSEKLAIMRQTHPNAFKPWPEADDTKLLGLHKKGMGLEKLSKKFGRHPGSIHARLKKHLGDDVAVSP
jgi:hypothetical protein